MRILAAKILIPQIAMRIELNQRNRSMLLRHRAQDRQADGVIASHANAADSRGKQRRKARLNAAKRVLNRKRVDTQIAVIGRPAFCERIYLQHRVPRPDNRRLVPNVSRAKPRSRPVGCTSVERHAD